MEGVIQSDWTKDDKLKSLSESFEKAKPFSYVKIENVLQKDFLGKLQTYVESMDFDKRHNDLYSFFQSFALQSLPDDKSTPIADLIKALYSKEFRNVLHKISGIECDDKMDLFASCYTDTNHLLCHDDQIGDRNIAFMLYLTPENWSKEDGGALDLFNTDPSVPNCPTTIAQSIIAVRNSVVLFRVSERSFHQVAEVLSDKQRVAIGGWFHGKPLQMSKPMPDPELIWKDVSKSGGGSGDDKSGELEYWLAKEYLEGGQIDTLQNMFADEGSLELMGFLKADKYYKLLEAMEACKWTLNGPRHRRWHYNTDINASDDIQSNELLQQWSKFIQSDVWKQYLKTLTGVDITQFTLETRKFGHKNYTIAHDLNRYKDEMGLDVTFCLLTDEAKGWKDEFGGTVHYMQMDDKSKTTSAESASSSEEVKNADDDDMSSEGDNELLSVAPLPNTLSIVYRSDPGAISFVKYVNNHAPSERLDIYQVWKFDKREGDDEDDPDVAVAEKEEESTKDKKADDKEELRGPPPQKKRRVE